ncbi:hypothetical protein EJ04DRAFT_608434 [Polyplosphaeria fusca]|uniref:Uncharacterized protein n=1 Tax=Polyplosphaeria fusca TaxID=682080 RepID=A0A9P4QTW0_9PLEO|nr:hypothetical protein EJ04DRAFT_608434 [Polyplosphaeria fusca]
MATSTTFHPFNRLPFECRQRVYYFALEGLFCTLSVIAYVHTSQVPWFPPFLSCLCGTSKTALIEAAPVFLEKCTIVVGSLRANRLLTNFLKALNNDAGVNKGFPSVRHLRFPNFHFFMGQSISGENTDIGLIVQCPELVHAELHFQIDNLFHTTIPSVDDAWNGNIFYEYKYEPKTVKEVADYFGLDKLASCPMLRKIKIRVRNYDDRVMMAINEPVLTMRSVVEWLMSEFSKKGYKVGIEVVWY